MSASNGNFEHVKYLLEKGANPNAENRQGSTGFILAAEKGHLDVVQLLGRRIYKIDIEKTDGKGRTALIWAAMKGHLPVVQYLMETKNANVNAEDLDGNTPLKLASQNNHTDVVSYIAGVDGGTNETQGNNDVLM